MPHTLPRLGRLLPTLPLSPNGSQSPLGRGRARGVRLASVGGLLLGLAAAHFAAVEWHFAGAVVSLCLLQLASGALLPAVWTACVWGANSLALAWVCLQRGTAGDALLLLAACGAGAAGLALARWRAGSAWATSAGREPGRTGDPARSLSRQAALAALAQGAPEALSRGIAATLDAERVEIWQSHGADRAIARWQLIASSTPGPDHAAPARPFLPSDTLTAALGEGGIAERVRDGGGRVLLAPILQVGRLAGVLRVERGADPPAWGAEEQLFLLAGAATVGLRLEADARRAAEESLAREVRERLRREQEVVRLHDELARRMEQRTADLDRVVLAHSDLQDALQRASTDWNATFDSLQFPLLLLDEEGTLGRCNRAACRALGRTAFSEVLGRSLAALAAAEPWPTVERLACEVASTATPQVRRVSDGRHTWELNASVVSAAPPRRVAILVVDVTGMLDLQAKLQRSQVLSAVGGLVAGVAHEVRGPLFAMSANLDCLEEEMAGHGEHLRAYVHGLRGEMDRVERLMRDLLEYARPPALSRAPTDPVRVAEAAAAACSRLREARGVALAVASSGTPYRLAADAHRLEQVLTNLIENAVHFTAAGTAVRVEVAFDADAVCITVLDEGPGFGARDLPHVFEPLYSRRSGGTGLGLAIAQRIVDEHGGTIAVGNRLTGGGCVVVTLPRDAGGDS